VVSTGNQRRKRQREAKREAEARQVRVYRNLNRKCWSVQRKVEGKGWRLSSHSLKVCLRDARLFVSAAGRERVRSEGSKNVHAYAQGTPIDTLEFSSQLKAQLSRVAARRPRSLGPPALERITYDPYRHDSFVDSGGAPVESVRLVLFDHNGEAWAVI